MELVLEQSQQGSSHEVSDASCVTSNNTVNASLTAQLARYKELAKVYEKRAQFELTERELMIDTQMRMIIKDHEGSVQDMAQNEDNIFQADQYDAFDFDVDEAPSGQMMFMANLSSIDPVYDEAGPSYDSDTLSE
nr:hypothetical protein [Tanacetum cinerariifolium]